MQVLLCSCTLLLLLPAAVVWGSSLYCHHLMGVIALLHESSSDGLFWFKRGCCLCQASNVWLSFQTGGGGNITAFVLVCYWGGCGVDGLLDLLPFAPAFLKKSINTQLCSKLFLLCCSDWVCWHSCAVVIAAIVAPALLLSLSAIAPGLPPFLWHCCHHLCCAFVVVHLLLLLVPLLHHHHAAFVMSTDAFVWSGWAVAIIILLWAPSLQKK